MLTKPTLGPSTITDYKPQLDGLRFIAVFVVIFYHYSSQVQSVTSIIDSSTLLAFFFVLSSYLITKVLLRGKEKGLQAGYPKYKVALTFLMRRTLRIFPAYYAYLLLIFLIPVGGIYLRENLEMFVLYLSNFQIYSDQQWNELTAHLWTLAVEEQFYLIWPWIIIFTPEKHLVKVFFLIVILGIGSRFLLFSLVDLAESQTVTIQVLTPTCLDSFGLGALLACRHRQGITRNPILKKILLAIGLIWICSISFNYLTGVLTLGRLFVSLFAMVIIEGAVNGYQNSFGRFLQNKIVLYLARISYGIYLYHIFSAFILWKLLLQIRHSLLKYLGLDISLALDFIAIPWVYFSLSVLLTIAMAAASWHLLESPINNLKRLFNYSAAEKTPKPGARQLAKQ